MSLAGNGLTVGTASGHEPIQPDWFEHIPEKICHLGSGGKPNANGGSWGIFVRNNPSVAVNDCRANAFY